MVSVSIFQMAEAIGLRTCKNGDGGRVAQNKVNAVFWDPSQAIGYQEMLQIMQRIVLMYQPQESN